MKSPFYSYAFVFVLAFAGALLTTPLPAYDAEDFCDATDTDYADGFFTTGDNGGGGTTGFLPWTVPAGAGGGVVITTGGILDSASTSTAFALEATSGGQTASRPHAVGSVAGWKFSVKLEFVPMSGSDTADFALGSTPIVGADPATSPAWMFASTTPSTVPLSEPVEVLVTDPTGSGATYDVEIKSLVSPASDMASFSGASAPSSFEFVVFSATAAPTAFAINDLIVDTTGTLPVELSAFTLE